jgi:hypothetical protein
MPELNLFALSPKQDFGMESPNFKSIAAADPIN